MTIVQPAVGVHIAYELRYIGLHALGQTYLAVDLSDKYDRGVRRDAPACDIAQLCKCVRKHDGYCTLRWRLREKVADPSIEDDEACIRLSHQEAIQRNTGSELTICDGKPADSQGHVSRSSFHRTYSYHGADDDAEYRRRDVVKPLASHIGMPAAEVSALLDTTSENYALTWRPRTP